MDKEVADLLAQASRSGKRPYWQSTPEEARKGPMLMNLLMGESPAVADLRDLSIPYDGVEVRARLYRPEGEVRGLLVYFHGGGWVLGSVADYHAFTATLAQRSGLAVLSVDYRLAPENPYPAALHDASAALRWGADWLAAQASVQATLIVMGDSAGANLATVAARLHNEREVRRVDFQVLAYPVVHHSFDSPSYGEFAQGYLLTRNDMKWFWNHYVPEVRLRSDPQISPLLTPDLTASPPGLLVSAGCDPLRDDGEAYGQRLAEAGVRMEVVRADGLVHGFLAMINYAPSAARVFDKILSAIRTAGQR